MQSDRKRYLYLRLCMRCASHVPALSIRVCRVKCDRYVSIRGTLLSGKVKKGHKERGKDVATIGGRFFGIWCLG